MIVIVEPQCLGLSHEKVNSGFLLLIRKAYPNEKIIVFADKSHIKSLEYIIKFDNLIIDDITFKSIYVPKFFTPFHSLYFFINIAIVGYFINWINVKQIYFLSFSPLILEMVFPLTKKLKKDVKVLMVLHGGFEEIKPKIFKKKIKSIYVQFNLKLYILNFTFLKVFYFLKRIKNNLYRRLEIYLSGFTSYNKVLLSDKSSSIKFISLAPYIVDNAAKYIDIQKINFVQITLPTVFKNLSSQRINSKTNICLAIFGYGNSKLLKELCEHISNNLDKIGAKLKIRIIGMDNSGVENFDFVECYKPGQLKLREEMEMQLVDVDFFLILYENYRYELSCSGSILEALSYRKPIIHIDNPCINFFNDSSMPIGWRFENIESLAKGIFEIINNEDIEISLNDFQQNIDSLRLKYGIEQQVSRFKLSIN
jgi:hypothetical protein